MNDLLPQDDSGDESSSSHNYPAIPDPRVAKLLDEMKLVYTICPETAVYRVNYRCHNGQTQKVIVESITEEVDDCEVRFLSSGGILLKGELDLPLAHFLLRANYFLIFGSWTIIPDRNQDIQAVLKVAVATTLSTTRFAFMLEMVAEMANSAPGEYEEFCKREF